MVKFLTLVLACAAGLLLHSCGGRAAQNQSAVEKGVMEYLKNRAGLDVTAMDVSVSSVSFRENEAEAMVTFRAKGSQDASNSMQMKYVLEQKDGKWVVKGRSGSGGHGSESHGGSSLPPGHPPAAGSNDEKK